MYELKVKLPGTLEMSEWEVNMIVASKLYELGKLSSGQATEMAGLSKRTFIEMLGKFNVSVFGYTAEELRQDLKNL